MQEATRLVDKGGPDAAYRWLRGRQRLVRWVAGLAIPLLAIAPFLTHSQWSALIPVALSLGLLVAAWLQLAQLRMYKGMLSPADLGKLEHYVRTASAVVLVMALAEITYMMARLWPSTGLPV